LSPSCPELSEPQHFTPPLASETQVWLPLALSEQQPVPHFTEGHWQLQPQVPLVQLGVAPAGTGHG